MGEDIKVADDMVVSITYVLEVDGEELDRAESDDPLQFLQGHSNIIPGLESALYGLGVGDKVRIVVLPEDGYGVRDEDGTDTFPRDFLPDEYEPSIGDPLQLRDADTGEVFEVTIVELYDDEVVVDFNHPLAGATLNFEVEILELRPASAEELAHGHVHSDGHSH